MKAKSLLTGVLQHFRQNYTNSDLREWSQETIPVSSVGRSRNNRNDRLGLQTVEMLAKEFNKIKIKTLLIKVFMFC